MLALARQQRAMNAQYLQVLLYRLCQRQLIPGCCGAARTARSTSGRSVGGLLYVNVDIAADIPAIVLLPMQGTTRTTGNG